MLHQFLQLRILNIQCFAIQKGKIPYYILSISTKLQLFDESINLTDGGPANASISMSHYIYNLCFKYVPDFGYDNHFCRKWLCQKIIWFIQNSQIH